MENENVGSLLNNVTPCVENSVEEGDACIKRYKALVSSMNDDSSGKKTTTMIEALKNIKRTSFLAS